MTEIPEAMVRSNDTLTEEEIWGTWEELLLACAVNRHGARSWDSVAAEVSSRSPYANLLTADNCKHRYHRLQRRFASGGAGGDEISGGDEIDSEEPTVEIPWLDELRRLRVAELRREVQRYDVSIGSLQLKVKKLKEERERSLGEPEVGDTVNGSGSRSGRRSDLKEKDNQESHQIESPRSKPENAAGDKISDEDSGRSCKESNSTERRVEQEVPVKERITEEADPAVNESRSGSRSDHVGGAEASCNGSSDTIAKGTVRSSALEPNQALNESGESVAESKGGADEEGTKENSDVQSSASLSRRRRRGRRRRASASAVAEPEAEASSPARKVIDAESQPLIAFLDTIRSNKDGSVFARRLVSQESVRYRSLIRRHVDLEMVRNRLGRSGYASAEFFRDLLLLCNNALVFYPKRSPESIAAVHLRDLINKGIDSILRKNTRTSPQSAKELTPPPTAAQQAQLAPPSPPSKPKSDPERLEKPGSLPPLVACRKRSSISAKPAKHGKKVEKVVKEEKQEREREEEIEEDADEDEDEEDDDDEKEKEKIADKMRTKQRTTVSRGLRTNKTRGNGIKGEGGGGADVAKIPKPEPVGAPKPDPAEQEAKSGGPSTAKKRSAADFLNRMKSSSPSSNGKLIETTKSPSSSRRGGSDQPQKKKVNEESKKERSAAASAGKRSVGRPPKRAAAMPAPPVKRSREEKTPPLPKKRGRR